MSARSVASRGGRLGVVGGPWLLPEATPTTAPTVVTAVAEATANPRTEIRLTRFPSSIARFGDLADAIVPLALASPTASVTGGTGPVGNSPRGESAWCSGGIRRTLLSCWYCVVPYRWGYRCAVCGA